MTVSVVIHAFNEEAYIEPCLQSVDWADEIVIIDLGSTDGTVEICRRYTDRILTHPRVEVVELARAFGLEKATGDWTLVLDPDERVCGGLGEYLRSIAGGNNADACILPFETWMFGRRISHSGWAEDEHVRFFRTRKVTWPAVVHSVPQVDGPVLRVGREHGFIRHENYVSIAHFIDKLNRYTTQEAARLRAEGRRFHWLKLFYQPTKDFLHRYFMLGGWRSGIVGLILPLMMAFYVQVSYIKLWELYQREAQGKDGER